jgi:hypothetical protein
MGALFKNDEGAGEFAALAVGLISDIFPSRTGCNVALQVQSKMLAALSAVFTIVTSSCGQIQDRRMACFQFRADGFVEMR